MCILRLLLFLVIVVKPRGTHSPGLEESGAPSEGAGDGLLGDVGCISLRSSSPDGSWACSHDHEGAIQSNDKAIHVCFVVQCDIPTIISPFPGLDMVT